MGIRRLLSKSAIRGDIVTFKKLLKTPIVKQETGRVVKDKFMAERFDVPPVMAKTEKQKEALKERKEKISPTAPVIANC